MIHLTQLLFAVSDGFPGTSSYVTVGPFTANAPYIATNFTCLFDTCTNDVVHSDNGCALDGGYATITCANGKKTEFVMLIQFTEHMSKIVHITC